MENLARKICTRKPDHKFQWFDFIPGVGLADYNSRNRNDTSDSKEIRDVSLAIYNLVLGLTGIYGIVKGVESMLS